MTDIQARECTCIDEPNIDCPIDGMCASYGHPCRCEAHDGRLTYVANANQMIAHLEKAGVVGPTLHPDVRDPDPTKVWNGWNRAVAGGIDATGYPINTGIWYLASGYNHYEYGSGGGTALLAADAFERITYPALMFAAVADIRHPQHTPAIKVQP